MTMASTIEKPIASVHAIGQCDRCGKDILAQTNTSYSLLKLKNYRIDIETYQLQMLLCEDCRKDLHKWMSKKIPIEKGDDTT